MLNRIDHAIDILGKAKKDKRTLTLVIGCVVSFGVAVGAIAVYERLVKELDAGGGQSYFRNERSTYFNNDEY